MSLAGMASKVQHLFAFIGVQHHFPFCGPLDRRDKAAGRGPSAV
jgi:hypothetical protein